MCSQIEEAITVFVMSNFSYYDTLSLYFEGFLIYIIYLLKISTLFQVREDEMGRACSTNGEKRNAYRIFVGKPEETTGKTKT
jgi:hypothetical protein